MASQAKPCEHDQALTKSPVVRHKRARSGGSRLLSATISDMYLHVVGISPLSSAVVGSKR